MSLIGVRNLLHRYYYNIISINNKQRQNKNFPHHLILHQINFKRILKVIDLKLYSLKF